MNLQLTKLHDSGLRLTITMKKYNECNLVTKWMYNLNKCFGQIKQCAICKCHFLQLIKCQCKRAVYLLNHFLITPFNIQGSWGKFSHCSLLNLFLGISIKQKKIFVLLIITFLMTTFPWPPPVWLLLITFNIV